MVKVRVADAPPWLWCDFDGMLGGHALLNGADAQRELDRSGYQLQQGQEIVVWQRDEEEPWGEHHVLIATGIVSWDETVGCWSADVEPFSIKRLTGLPSAEEAALSAVAPRFARVVLTEFDDADHATVRLNMGESPNAESRVVLVERHESRWYEGGGRSDPKMEPYFATRGSAAAHLGVLALFVAVLTHAFTAGGASGPNGEPSEGEALLVLWMLSMFTVYIYALVVAWPLREKWGIGWFGWFLGGGLAAWFVTLFRLFSPMRFWEAGAMLGLGPFLRSALVGALVVLAVVVFLVGKAGVA